MEGWARRSGGGVEGGGEGGVMAIAIQKHSRKDSNDPCEKAL